MIKKDMKKFKNWINNNITLHNYDNRKEEWVNGLTHGAGIILSIIGLIFLIYRGAHSSGLFIANLVYAFTMLLLFTASTVYHLIKDPFIKRIGRVLDHSNIYLLIAGTYTPIAFYVGGKIGIYIIAIEWGFALIGIIFTLKFWGRLKPLHIVFYLIMGWMIIIIWSSFLEKVPIEFAKLILIGGITYTIGVIIYTLKKLPFYHGIWHLFVVGGATIMYIGIYRYLR
jgi:hemolysin III